ASSITSSANIPGNDRQTAALLEPSLSAGDHQQSEVLFAHALAVVGLGDLIGETICLPGAVKIGDNLLRQLHILIAGAYRERSLRRQVIDLGLRDHIAQGGLNFIRIV